MDDKTYQEIKKMLDSTVAECRALTARLEEASRKCEQYAELCTDIAHDLAERGDSA